MKVCHIIPPKVLPLVDDFLCDQHLLLPALLTTPEYRSFYQKKATIDWLTLDNGVAEGRRMSFGHIMAMAKVAQVQEVVLPDILGDMERTLGLLSETFYEAFQYRNDYRFMFVLQGKTMKELIHCAEQAMNMCPVLINTFGIPRHILSEGIAARAQIAWELTKRFPNRSIHLLGTHPNVVDELDEMSRDFKDAGVRSVDTSLAWNAMLESVRLKDPKSLSYNSSINRQPIDEFATASLEPGFEEAQLRTLCDNMEAINSWV